MPAADPTTAYLRSKVFSATPEELHLMLIEGCIRFCRQGREAMVEKRHEALFNALSSAKSILMEMTTSLRADESPDLAAKLHGLYLFMYRRLIDANIEKSPEIIDEVLKLLDYERETWSLVIEKRSREQGGAPAAPKPAHGVPRAPTASGISFQG